MTDNVFERDSKMGFLTSLYLPPSFFRGSIDCFEVRRKVGRELSSFMEAMYRFTNADYRALYDYLLNVDFYPYKYYLAFKSKIAQLTIGNYVLFSLLSVCNKIR